MIDEALMKVVATCQLMTAVLEWNGSDVVNKTWPEWKAHFIKAYNI